MHNNGSVNQEINAAYGFEGLGSIKIQDLQKSESFIVLKINSCFSYFRYSHKRIKHCKAQLIGYVLISNVSFGNSVSCLGVARARAHTHTQHTTTDKTQKNIHGSAIFF